MTLSMTCWAGNGHQGSSTARIYVLTLIIINGRVAMSNRIFEDRILNKYRNPTEHIIVFRLFFKIVFHLLHVILAFYFKICEKWW